MQKGKLLALVMALVLMLAVAASAGATVKYEVIKPRNYSSNVNYPVVYVMPEDGYRGDGGVASLLAKSNGIDAILVKPSFSKGMDLYTEMETLVAEIDSKYSTIADADHRAIVGTGVGGYLAYILGTTDDKAALSAPNMFSFIASIRGDFASSKNPWLSYGDVKVYLEAAGKTAFTSFYTYMDTPVDDAWANMAGSTNDLGQLFINWATPNTNHEYTARLGSFSDAFLQESINRIANRMTVWMLSSIVSGSAAPESTAVSAKNSTADINYTVNLGAALSTHTEANTSMKVTVSVVDSADGSVLSTSTKTHTVSTEAPSVSGVMEDMNIQMSGSYATVNMSVTLLGGKMNVSSADLVYVYDPEYDGDYQTFDLMGDDWHFKYTGSKSARALSVAEVMEQYEDWHTVLPALGNWKGGYGNIVNNPYMGSYADFMHTGDGYYVKNFTLPTDFNTQEPVLSIGYVDDRCEVWFNGKRLGGTGMKDDGTSNGKTTWAKLTYFELDPADLVFEGEGTNTVIVRAFNDTPYGAGGWYNGPVGLYSMTAYNQKYGFGSNQYFYEETFYSDAIGANNEYIVYLPQDYYESDRFYPTMYLLHQFNSDHSSYMTDKINEKLNAAIEEGLFDEMIVVIPNSAESSWWKNEWEKMVVEDLIPHIESKYRSIPDARYRLTAGCSMGGQGAFSVALRNPNYFSGTAAFFGAFDYGDGMGSISPITLANNEGAEYMDYFTMAFICGNQDDYSFGNGKIEMNQLLEEYGIDHYFFIENGGHNSAFYVPYFADTIAYVRNNMYQMPEVNIDDLLQANYGISRKHDALVVSLEASEEIRKFFLNVPDSKYTVNTHPGVTLPVMVTLKLKGGDEVIVRFNATFNRRNLRVVQSFDLNEILPENAKIVDVKVHTQLLGGNYAKNDGIEEVPVIKNPDLPETGDNSNLMLLCTLLFVSVAGIAVMSRRKASC